MIVTVEHALSPNTPMSLLLLPHNGHHQLVDCYAMSKACAVQIYKILPAGSSIQLKSIYTYLHLVFHGSHFCLESGM